MEEETELNMVPNPLVFNKHRLYESDPIELDELSNIDFSSVKKLKNAGIMYVDLIVAVPLQKLIEIGIHKQKAVNIKSQAYKTFNEIKNFYGKISTGSKSLDGLLGGGVETGVITEFFGEHGTYKTQIAHQLSVNVQLDLEKGGLEGEALYIDTEGKFRPERINQMASALNLDIKKVLRNITYIRVDSSFILINPLVVY